MIAEILTFTAKGRCSVERREIDEIPEGRRVIVRNSLSLISPGTELAMFNRTHRGFADGGVPFAKYPFYPGYAAVGEVVAASPGVTDFSVGDRVHHRSPHATYSEVDADRCVRLPDGLEEECAAFITFLQIAVTSVHVAPADRRENVVVVGMGLVGNLAARLYRMRGAALVAGADLIEKRLVVARAVGAVDVLFDVSDKPLTEWVGELGENGAGLVVDAVGASSSIDSCLKSAAPGGRVVLLGSPRTKMEIDPYFDIHRKGVRLIGAHGNVVGSEARKKDVGGFIEQLQSGGIRVRELITRRVPYTEARDAYEALGKDPENHLGVILTYR